ncbi:MAG TPA: DUF2865 domain-containing protein [Xanthobacteraceae bacterium]|jgi:hypothetical protein
MTPPRLAGIASLAALSLAALLGAAGAQLLPPQNVPGGAPPGVQGPRPLYGPTDRAACVRLESALAQLDSVSASPNIDPEQVRRYEEAINRQRFELDQTIVQARRLGCDSGNSFFIFGPQRPPQCDRLNDQIGRMRANLDRMISELGTLRGAGTDLNRDLQRRQLINQLAQNNCGPQYRQAAPQPQRQRGLLETLFGGGGWREESTVEASPLDLPGGNTYRTLCVRTCDGFFFPISFATIPARFGEDEHTCKRLCPAAETMLFAHRNPGEEVDQAVSINGTPYTQLPSAFKYRTAFNASCSCRAAGQSWADALGVTRDETLQQGDILVTEQRARQMSQPRPIGGQQKGKGQPTANTLPAEQQPQAAAKEEPPPATVPGDRKVRTVGPQFYPVR